MFKLDILYFQDLIERLKSRYEDMYSAITYSKELILSIAINNNEDIDEILNKLMGKFETSSEFKKVVKEVVKPTMREQFQTYLIKEI